MKPADHMPPGEWSALLKVFADVTKLFGGNSSHALKDIRRALASGKVVAMVQTLADGKCHELSADFWQSHKLSSGGQGHIVVSGKEYPPMEHCYFLHDVGKVWRVNDRVATAPDKPSLPPWRKNSVGTKTGYDWEKILIEAARYMWEEGVPQSEAKLRSHIEEWCKGDAPGESQLKSHLAPLYRALKNK